MVNIQCLAWDMAYSVKGYYLVWVCCCVLVMVMVTQRLGNNKAEPTSLLLRVTYVAPFQYGVPSSFPHPLSPFDMTGDALGGQVGMIRVPVKS